MTRSLRLFAVCILSLVSIAQAASPVVTPGARVAVVGDSITEQKLYSKYIELYLLACSGIDDVRVFQFGWSGETASGFSQRLENDLTAFQPTIVTLCYGMNDGGYRPYDDAVGKNYENNMRSVLTKLGKLGIAKVVVGSPGAVDSDTFRPGQQLGTQPAHVAYNDNLAHLRDIDRALATEFKLHFADVHGAMVDAMGKAKAVLGSSYDVCGRDGFHPGPNGQLLMAYGFLKGLELDGQIGTITVDLKGTASATEGHKVTNSSAGKVELVSSRWPFCFEGDDKSSGGTRSIVPFVPFNEQFNRLTLKVTGLDAAKAKVDWGSASKEFTREQLATGVNLAAEFNVTPFDAPFQQLNAAVTKKQAFETYMIKSLITQFRSLPPELRDDSDMQSAVQALRAALVKHHQKLDQETRLLVVPVKHALSVTPLP